jgi:hypothetical protein
MGNTVADRSSNEADLYFSVYFLYLHAVMGKCCDACGDEELLSPVAFLGVRGCPCFIGIDCR